jgi:hypothetical protein
MQAVNEPSAGATDPLHAAFRPRRGRKMATIFGTAAFLAFAVIAVFAPMGHGHYFDRAGIIAFGAAIGGLLWRFARLAVFVDEQGLVVRNLAGDRRLEWAEVVIVRFGGGHPWVMLDLSDGEPLAVMAIQRADGPFGEAEAQRLATLVELHSEARREG